MPQERWGRMGKTGRTGRKAVRRAGKDRKVGKDWKVEIGKEPSACSHS
jgi:hypothetical protein